MHADQIYRKPSAYKSGYIVKTYKQLGGTYTDDKKDKPLKRWFNERWQDIGNKAYPVYRPTVRINKKTPLLSSEIKPKQLKEQIKLKQVFEGKEKQKINLDKSQTDLINLKPNSFKIFQITKP
jgi:hypothetical protein